MTENSEPRIMDTAQKVSVSDHINSSSRHTNINSDSFTLDLDRFNSIINSRILGNHLRKTAQRIGEKKMSSSDDNDIDGSTFITSSSSPEALVGTRTVEQPIVMTVGAFTNDPINQQIHHQITITTPTATASSVNKPWGKKYMSFKRSSSFWTTDPRRLLLFFAFLSSMGSVLLIYFTLTMGN